MYLRIKAIDGTTLDMADDTFNRIFQDKLDAFNQLDKGFCDNLTEHCSKFLEQIQQHEVGI